MAFTKKYDIAVKTGEYTDRNGETKGRYENVGSVMSSDKGPFIILKRTFNPAGVPNPENKDSVLLSLFEPKEAAAQQDSFSTPKPGAPSRTGTPPPPASTAADDDVPF